MKLCISYVLWKAYGRIIFSVFDFFFYFAVLLFYYIFLLLLLLLLLLWLLLLLLLFSHYSARKKKQWVVSCVFHICWHLFRIQPLNHFIFRVRISDSRIDFAFSWIILSNILWNSRIKTSLLLELSSSGKLRSFCLHFKLNNSLIFYSKKW